MTLKNVLPAVVAFAASVVGAFAQGEGSYTVPAGVTEGLNDLEAAATGITNAVIPALIAIGLSFLGCWIAVRLFRWFKSVGGR